MVTAWKKRLGEEIGKARRLHSDHLTQEQLAEIAGLCRNSIGHYERGERAPDFDELRRIAIALSREHFDVDENIRIEFSPNGKTHLQTPPQQLNLDFDENHGVSVRIEPVGQGLVIRKISA